MSTTKVAYVRSAEMVSKFIGMKEAERIYEGKAAVWQANIDTLTYNFQKSVSEYEVNYSKWSVAKRQEAQQSLKRQEQNLDQYRRSIEEKASEEKEKITQGALNQINAYIERYSKEKGYDLVIGVTLSGNVLYGVESIDITEDVIKGLNESYKK
jgi:outer membrane protein